VRGHERVGVGGDVAVALLGLPLRGLQIAEVVLEVVRLERLAEGHLLRVADAELLADLADGGERVDGEVDAGVQVAQIGQLDAKCLLHGGEVQDGVRLHAALVQRVPRAGQPFVLLGPPQGVIGPVDRDIWNKTPPST